MNVKFPILYLCFYSIADRIGKPDTKLSLFLELFTPAFGGGPLMESERQQVSSGLQDSSEYSSRSQRCILLSFNSFENFSHQS